MDFVKSEKVKYFCLGILTVAILVGIIFIIPWAKVWDTLTTSLVIAFVAVVALIVILLVYHYLSKDQLGNKESQNHLSMTLAAVQTPTQEDLLKLQSLINPLPFKQEHYANHNKLEALITLFCQKHQDDAKLNKKEDQEIFRLLAHLVLVYNNELKYKSIIRSNASVEAQLVQNYKLDDLLHELQK